MLSYSLRIVLHAGRCLEGLEFTSARSRRHRELCELSRPRGDGKPWLHVPVPNW